MITVYLLRAKQQIVERHIEQRKDIGAGPVMANGIRGVDGVKSHGSSHQKENRNIERHDNRHFVVVN